MSAERKGTVVLWDLEEAFESVKERIADAVGDTHDVMIYSIMPTDGTKRRLIIKMTHAGHMDEYLSHPGFSSREQAVTMLHMSYRQGPYVLPEYVSRMKEMMDRASSEGRYLTVLYSGSTGVIESSKIEHLFKEKVQAQSEKQGEIIYLRDQAFFASLVKNPQHVTFADLALMSSGRGNVLAVDMSHADTGRITDMSFLFSGLSSVGKLDLSGMDTGNATSMFCMFMDCANLEKLDLSGFDFTNVKSSSLMFSGCESLKEVIFHESMLKVPVIHETQEMGRIASPYTSWVYGNAPIPEHELAEKLIAVRKEISFAQATDSERRRHLGLGPQTKITIAAQKQPAGRK